jgi:hypothetical protein
MSKESGPERPAKSTGVIECFESALQCLNASYFFALPLCGSLRLPTHPASLAFVDLLSH